MYMYYKETSKIKINDKPEYVFKGIHVPPYQMVI